MFTHIIFDLDGTLLNTIDDLADAGNHVCAARGWPTHTVDQFKRMVGNGIPNLVERFSPEGTDRAELSQALAEFSAYYGEHKEDKTAPYPGVPELLAGLKASGVHLAVLSNKAHALAGPVVEHYFPGVFEYVQGALPDAPLKPDPTLLRALMEQLGARPEDTLFVGDSDVDVLTGKNGGLTVVGVLWGFRGRKELERAGADYVIDRPEQLIQPQAGRRPSPKERNAQERGWMAVGCALAWPISVFLAFWEVWYLTAWNIYAQEVAKYGLDFVMEHYPRLADNYLTARTLALITAVPLSLTLALAVLCTKRLRELTPLKTRRLFSGEADKAAALLRKGRLVAVPTETVYGLAADATQEKAVQANYDAKGRPETKPLNVLVDGMQMAETVCRDIPEDAYRLADAFWPGPLTMILWGNGALPSIVPAGGKTQGVRCPDHPDTLAVIRVLGRPLACPSANLSGRPSPKSADDVLAQLNGRIHAVLDGGACTVGVESTILDLTVTPYRILRQGGLDRAAIEAVLDREVAG